MEQLVYTVTPSHSAHTALSSDGYLRLLQARLTSFEALAECLLTCRSAFAKSDVEAIMQAVEIQSSHCNEITRVEERLAPYTGPNSHPHPQFLSPAEAERAQELLRRAVEIKHAVQQLNRAYAGLVRKAAHNNAVLRNLYATAFVYADPRASERASCERPEE